VLASRFFDRHTTYVALSRHRAESHLFYAREDFAAGGKQGAGFDAAATRARFIGMLSRARPKELAHDYLERELDVGSDTQKTASVRPRPPTPDEIQAAARERWLAYRAQVTHGHAPSLDAGRDHTQEQGHEPARGPEHPDDDLSL
jgi:hypothetical protein